MLCFVVLSQSRWVTLWYVLICLVGLSSVSHVGLCCVVFSSDELCQSSWDGLGYVTLYSVKSV
jgi:hypothetical protein